MKMNRSQSSRDREQIALALREWKEDVNLRAFGTTCPMPGCGALAVTYESEKPLDQIFGSAGADFEFVCSECGAEFTAPDGDLLFQSVPREWLFAQVCSA